MSVHGAWLALPCAATQHQATTKRHCAELYEHVEGNTSRNTAMQGMLPANCCLCASRQPKHYPAPLHWLWRSQQSISVMPPGLEPTLCQARCLESSHFVLRNSQCPTSCIPPSPALIGFVRADGKSIELDAKQGYPNLLPRNWLRLH